MTAFRIPRTRFSSIRRPVLVMNGSKTDPRLEGRGTGDRRRRSPVRGIASWQGRHTTSIPAYSRPRPLEFLELTAMRFMIMHKTQPPVGGGRDPETGSDRAGGRAARRAGQARKLLGGGRASRQLRKACALRFSSGTRTIVHGPFDRRQRAAGRLQHPARAVARRAAIEWATRQAEVLGDGEVDIRPVTEPWDIGMAPKPEA